MKLEKSLHDTAWSLKADRKFLIQMHQEINRLFGDIESHIARTKVRIMEKFEKEIGDKSNAFHCARVHEKLQ